MTGPEEVSEVHFEYTEDGAMLNGMQIGPDYDETSTSAPEPKQQLEQGQEFEPEQQPELDPGPEQQLESKQVSEPNRSQRVPQSPRMVTYNTLGQPTICSVQTGPSLVIGWFYLPFQSPWMFPTHQYHAPPCYVPLVYPPYMPMMYV